MDLGDLSLEWATPPQVYQMKIEFVSSLEQVSSIYFQEGDLGSVDRIHP